MPDPPRDTNSHPRCARCQPAADLGRLSPVGVWAGRTRRRLGQRPAGGSPPVVGKRSRGRLAEPLIRTVHVVSLDAIADMMGLCEPLV
jgi:hypothetical protein